MPPFPAEKLTLSIGKVNIFWHEEFTANRSHVSVINSGCWLFMTKKYTFQEAIYFYYIVMRSSLLHRSGSDLFLFYCQEELYITRVEVIYLYYIVGVAHEIFFIWSFPQTAPPGPIWDVLGPVFFYGVIELSKWLPSAWDTEERTKNSWARKFLSNYNKMSLYR